MRRYLLAHETLPMAARLEIAGCGCTVRTNAAPVISSLRRWRADSEELVGESTAAGCRRHRRRDAGATKGIAEEFELSVLVDDSLKRGPTLPQFRGRRQFMFAVFHDADTFVFDLLERRVSAVVSEETAGDVAFWTTALIPIAMGVLGPALGIAPLHSACLEAGGRGILIAGLSGAGKSTLATALAKEGMALVSDDWIYARESCGRVTVHGLGVPVKLMPDTVRFFDELQRSEPRTSLNGELAFEVDAQGLGVEATHRCEPDCIVFLERGVEERRIVPLERSVAMDFFERSAERLPDELAETDARRRKIIAAVTGRDCWRFQYSGTPREGAALLKRFFEETYDVDCTCATAS